MEPTDGVVTRFGGGGRLNPEVAADRERGKPRRKVNMDSHPAGKRRIGLQPPATAVPAPESYFDLDEPDETGWDMREIVSTILELAGITLLTAGCWLIAPWCGLVVLGLCLIIMGVATSRTWDAGES